MEDLRPGETVQQSTPDEIISQISRDQAFRERMSGLRQEHRRARMDRIFAADRGRFFLIEMHVDARAREILKESYSRIPAQD